MFFCKESTKCTRFMKGILGDCSDIPENLAEPTLTLTARGAFDAGVADSDGEAPEFTQRRRDRGPDSRFREADVALRATKTPPDHLIGRQVGVLRYAVYGVRGLAAAGAPSATAAVRRRSISIVVTTDAHTRSAAQEALGALPQ